MTENLLVVTGNLTADPELRYTQSGHPVASFTVAHTPRTFDRAANEWKDGESLFVRCSAWRDLGENVAASLVKGTRVTVSGALKQRSYQDREGNQRTSMELDCDEVAVSLRYATVGAITRSQGTRGQSTGGRAQQAQPQQEPWATPQGQRPQPPAQPQQAQPWTGGYDSDVPF